MRQYLTVSQKTYADAVGVSKQAISKLTKKNLKAWMQDGKIKYLSATSIAYAKQKGLTRGDLMRAFGAQGIFDKTAEGGKLGGRPPKPKPVITAEPVADMPEEISEFLDMTLRQLVEKFGTEARFQDWLKSVKMLGEIEDRRFKNMIAQKEVISREYVKKHVFGYQSALQERLLQDAPRTIVARIISKHEAGESREDITTTVSKILTEYMKESRAKIKKGLKE